MVGDMEICLEVEAIRVVQVNRFVVSTLESEPLCSLALVEYLLISIYHNP
jgi:hypothetical protein